MGDIELEATGTTVVDVLAIKSVERIKNIVFADVIEWGELVRAVEALPDGHPGKADAEALAHKQGARVMALAVAVSERIRAKP